MVNIKPGIIIKRTVVRHLPEFSKYAKVLATTTKKKIVDSIFAKYAD